MTNTPTKKESLDRTDTDFLRCLASELNGDYFGSYREYTGRSRDEMLNLVSNRLTVEEVEDVVSRYLLCHTPQDISDSINPDGTRDLKKAVETFFDEDGVFEARIDGRYCDVVFPESLTAVEIKSARDKVNRAPDQTEDYAVWADEVYLACDVSHEDSVHDNLLSDGIGILIYEDGEILLEESATSRPSSKEDLLASMTQNSLRSIAKDHEVAIAGKKQELVSRLASNLSQSVVRSEFANYTRQRGRLEI